MTMEEIVKALTERRDDLKEKAETLIAAYNRVQGALTTLAGQVEEKTDPTFSKEDRLYGCKVGDRTKKSEHLEGLKPKSMAYQQVMDDFKTYFKHVGRGWFERVS